MNPLTDLLPAKARKYLYAILSGALYVYGLWQAAKGDYGQFVVSVASATVTTLAASNVDTSGIAQCPDPGMHDPMLGGE